MTAPAPPLPAVVAMGQRLTTPFARGADVLPLTLVAAGPSATVAPYDFSEHQARFGAPPDPLHLLVATADVETATIVTVTVDDPALGGTVDVAIAIPAGTLAGATFAIPLPGGASPQARVSRVSPAPASPSGHPEDDWGLLALLGLTARVLWVLGAERDGLRRQLARTVAQRHLATALGPSLDLIGADLGVPRFPGLPYGYDAATVAIWHLDDAPGASPAIEDFTGRYPGRTGHPGTLAGAAEVGAGGRYGTAVHFGSDDAAVTVVTSPDFDLAAGGSLTVEFFARPDAGLAAGHLLGRRPGPDDGVGVGWRFHLGDFGRGVAGSVRFSVSDGTVSRDLFTDLPLPTDRFTHLAAVIDGASGSLALYQDGVAVDGTPVDGIPVPLGALADPAALVMGPSGTGLRGSLDEVRISSVARPDFFPALGESDEHYRRRLETFRRWTLPTPGVLQARLNDAVGTIGGSPDALVVLDDNDTAIRGGLLVRVVPVSLLGGESMDAAGRRGVTEADVYGAQPEDDVDPLLLSRIAIPGIVVAPPPGTAPQPGQPSADPGLVQDSVLQLLTRLLALTSAESPGGQLHVAGGFDPAATGARATGRAAIIAHTSIAAGRLAALAHRADADLVQHQPDDSVMISCGPGGLLGLDAAPAGGPPLGAGLAFLGADVAVGSSLTLTLRPPAPPDADVEWVVVPAGAGRVQLTASGPASATVLAQAAGPAVVTVEVRRGPLTFSATVQLTVALDTLADGGVIAADGTPALGPDVTGDPGPPVDPVYLVQHNATGVDYGADPDNHLMQRAVAARLDALVAALAAQSEAGNLVVSAAYKAGAPGLAGLGRRLTITHEVLDAGQLAALAQAAGFSAVQRSGPELILLHRADQLIGLDSATLPDGGQLEEGAAAQVAVAPDPAAVGSGSLLSWSSGPAGNGQADVDSTTLPVIGVHGVQAGGAWVQAAYTGVDDLTPYQFDVRLRPDLEATDAVISKDQYDLVMNLLNTLHPLGVEVRTQAVRDRVIEVRDDPLGADPDYTYPKFRLHRPVTGLREESVSD